MFSTNKKNDFIIFSFIILLSILLFFILYNCFYVKSTTYTNERKPLSMKYLNNETALKINTKNTIHNDEYNITNYPKFAFIAHRGLSAFAPANTASAFKLASRNGYNFVETDFSTTKDNHWVIMHDPVIDKVTNGKGAVKDIFFNDIEKLKIVKGSNISKYPNERILTIDEFLSLCMNYKLHPILEIKDYNSDSNLDLFIQSINNHNFSKNVTISCFHRKPLMEIRKRDKNIALLLLCSKTINNSEVNFVKSLGNTNMAIAYNKDYDLDIKLLHQNKLKAIFYTINNLNIANNLIKDKADFILTDGYHNSYK